MLASDPLLSLEWDEWDVGADRFLETGVAISEDEFGKLERDYDALLLGAMGDPRVPSGAHAREILLGLRFRLDLYVNFRPCHVRHAPLAALRCPGGDRMAIDVIRENTEGVYAGVGGILKKGTPHEIAIEEDLNTRVGVERIIRAAFDFAEAHGRERVTMVDKANAMPSAGSLWRRTFTEVSEAFPGVRTETMHVDAMAMDLVRRPDHHRVVVTSNLFGDILSDLAAALAGGLGLAPSANLHPGKHALFEPVHGSAPDIAGTGTANPMAAMLCVGLMMETLGRDDLARAVEAAVRGALESGDTTPDLGGSSTTEEVGRRVSERLAALISPAQEGEHG